MNSIDAPANSASGSIATLRPEDFEKFRKLAYDQFGLDLRPGKEQLLSVRLDKKLRELGLDSYKDYYDHVVGDKTGEALVALIDVLTTNHTNFFREMGHFEFLTGTILPAMGAREQISIWSAACSTGEEPYSIAFSVLQHLGSQALPRLRILATDISTRVLAKAESGIYQSDRFRDVPPTELRAYLLRSDAGGATKFLVKKEVRQAITFRRLNLMEPFSHGMKFPLIFCRNVMIYFDRKTQEDVVQRLSDTLEPGGYLFIGHAESLNGLDVPLEYVRPAIYRKPPGSQPASKLLGNK